MGHKIDKNGLHTLPDKIEAIMKSLIHRNRNPSQLRTFLGLVHYYQQLLPNLSTTLHPLYLLLKKGNTYKWTPACEKAYIKIKSQLTSTQVLVPYDETLPLTLATDALPVGLGAVLSHIMPDGTERIRS